MKKLVEIAVGILLGIAIAIPAVMMARSSPPPIRTATLDVTDPVSILHFYNLVGWDLRTFKSDKEKMEAELVCQQSQGMPIGIDPDSNQPICVPTPDRPENGGHVFFSDPQNQRAACQMIDATVLSWKDPVLTCKYNEEGK